MLEQVDLSLTIPQKEYNGLVKQHHKVSRDMILDLDIPGLAKQDHLLCALVARYHTEALADKSRHRRFASLDLRGRGGGEWLSGILRVADGLDCTHTNTVRGLSCKVGERAIMIHLEVTGDCREEVERTTRKQELLVRKAGKMIPYRC